MKIVKQTRDGRIHHTLDIDGILYFRNEKFECDTNGVLVYRNVTWRVGDEDGEGPYVEPSGTLDKFKKYTPDELEETFNKTFI